MQRPTLSSLVRSRDFLMLYVSSTLATTTLFVPFVFLPAYARDHGASEVAGAALVSVIGGTSIIGRLLLGPVAGRVGVVPLFKATVLVMAISYMLWQLSDYAWLVVFAAVLGTSYGSRIAAVPALLIEFFGLENLGTTLGVFFTAAGVAALLGPLLAELAIEWSGSYGGILFALATGLAGFAALLPLRGDQPSGAVVDGVVEVSNAPDSRHWTHGGGTVAERGSLCGNALVRCRGSLRGVASEPERLRTASGPVPA